MRIDNHSDRDGLPGRMYLGPLLLIVVLLVGWVVIADWQQLPSAFQITMAQLP